MVNCGDSNIGLKTHICRLPVWYLTILRIRRTRNAKTWLLFLIEGICRLMSSGAAPRRFGAKTYRSSFRASLPSHRHHQVTNSSAWTLQTPQEIDRYQHLELARTLGDALDVYVIVVSFAKWAKKVPKCQQGSVLYLADFYIVTSVTVVHNLLSPLQVEGK